MSFSCGNLSFSGVWGAFEIFEVFGSFCFYGCFSKYLWRFYE